MVRLEAGDRRVTKIRALNELTAAVFLLQKRSLATVDTSASSTYLLSSPGNKASDGCPSEVWKEITNNIVHSPDRLRFHYIDFSRAVLFSLGIVLHAAWFCRS